ncbi:pyrimidine dimer DNA glycosylase [Arthrobacter sp. SW1]|uniref:pyrimidine dimer DNA glycosylase/endonuclease V n=1 Tax=Arthrobacter sp. SW1 TaxID=1920889 RepID=UPI000877B842|nr:pyrimidine dimer DNA glycosylase/endonuclease V [Arthrobacter sp. SW1]OFI37650.1 pyrimidine dimer DNA glycosylase [Arthrobacter sp. SW1]
MRIWSLHPRQLDRAGLVACWRETLLAQAVLAGRTKGYQNHPQLVRFRADAEPLAAVGSYLSGVAAEAAARGYNFDAGRIIEPGAFSRRIPVTQGQLDYEWQHLGAKLQRRSPEDAVRWSETEPAPHPLFFVVDGPVEDWERVR